MVKDPKKSPEVLAAEKSGRFTVRVAIISGIFGIVVAVIGSNMFDDPPPPCPISQEALEEILDRLAEIRERNFLLVSKISFIANPREFREENPEEYEALVEINNEYDELRVQKTPDGVFIRESGILPDIRNDVASMEEDLSDLFQNIIEGRFSGSHNMASYRALLHDSCLITANYAP